MIWIESSAVWTPSNNGSKVAGWTTGVARYEADYRRAVIRRFDYMELLGADIPREARPASAFGRLRLAFPPGHRRRRCGKR